MPEHISTEQREHIGRLSERSLHAALKQWYAQPGDQIEARHGPYVVDITRGEALIEIQTGNFSSIREKLYALADEHPITLVYPIAVRKWIVHIDAVSGEVLRRRQSPKRGKLTDLFDQLVYAPNLLDHPHIVIEVALVHEDEIRCNDGRGSWRRKGISIIDHQLVEVVDVVRLERVADLAALLPNDLPQPFTHRELAKALQVRQRLAQRMSYCLRQVGLLHEVGKRGRAMLLEQVAIEGAREKGGRSSSHAS